MNVRLQSLVIVVVLFSIRSQVTGSIESRIGLDPQSRGCSNAGHGLSVMISECHGYYCTLERGGGRAASNVSEEHFEERVCKSEGPCSLSTVLQGARISKESITAEEGLYSTWPREQKVQDGVTVHEVEVKNVKTLSGIELGIKRCQDEKNCMPQNGMSNITAKGYKYERGGIEGSRRAAAEDMVLYHKFEKEFEEAARVYGVPKSVIAGIASRESRIGGALPSNGYGYAGHEYGVMQIDSRSHTVDMSGGPYSLANILQGARILKNSITAVERKHPGWTKEQQLQGGVAAYNFGVKNVQTLRGIDRGSTGGDYSSDVMVRAKYFEEISK